jgi:beta-N-acetylhexosaminidase
VTALALLAALALAGGPAGAAALPRLGDAQLTGQRMVAGFEGEHPPAALRRRIEAGRLAGVILFADNFDSRAEAERLARELHAIRRPRGLRAPLLVMIDQEGGPVRRLPGPPQPSAEQMGRSGKRECRRQGAATAKLLRSTRVNVDLAPVLDVARRGSVMDDENRAFGRDPGRVTACGGAFAAALDRHGIAPAAKHFPGLGAASRNTDDAVQRIEVSARRLRRVDEAPYRRFAAGGAANRLVMISSAIYPAFAGGPAAFSAAIVRRELRGRLGFEGVSITDALETASTAAFGGPSRAARRAARAGTDLLLFASLDSARAAAKRVRKLLDRGPGTRQRFRRSVARVLDLRAKLSG